MSTTFARVLMCRWVCVTMMMMMMIIIQVQGHGRLWEPPSRSSMWRRDYSNPVNYQDMELFCGGVAVQYDQNGGKCGVCGDPWNGPRHNEAGGRYANGIIVRKYQIGQVIDVVVQLTANHKGYFEFHLCPSDNPFAKVTHDCLAKYPLIELTSGTSRYPVPPTTINSEINVQLRLPPDVRCRACMLQWKYTAGNSWGVNPDGTQCIGCGQQEQFYGCADVAIGHDDVELGKPAIRHPWYIETETEWHFGVVTYTTNRTNGATAGVFQTNNMFSSWLVKLGNLVIVILTFLVTL